MPHGQHFLRTAITAPLVSFSTLLVALLLPSATTANELPLSDLVRATKKALLQVERDWNAPELSLSNVVLTVNASMETTAEGKVSFFVIELGGNASRNFASTMILTLEPPPPDSASDVGLSTISDALASSILAAGGAIEEATLGQPPLIATAYIAEVKFAVTASGSGEVSLAFPPFDIGAAASINSTEIHSIRATFKRHD